MCSAYHSGHCSSYTPPRTSASWIPWAVAALFSASRMISCWCPLRLLLSGSASGGAGRDFLKHPFVAVGVVEGREEGVVGTLGAGAVDLVRGPGRWKSPSSCKTSQMSIPRLSISSCAASMSVTTSAGLHGAGRRGVRPEPKMIDVSDPGGVIWTTGSRR